MTELLGVTTFCDDIRFEQGNKLSLMGCYDREMLIYGALPTVLPKLGFLVQLRLPSGHASPSRLAIYLPGNDDKPAFEMDLGAASEDNIEKSKAPPLPGTTNILATNVPVLLSPLPIECDGLIKVRVQCGSETIKCGTLAIKSIQQTNANHQKQTEP
jgi:hypothetical protein